MYKVKKRNGFIAPYDLEKISIAPNDRLFIGKKEILPTEAPEIFSSHVCI